MRLPRLIDFGIASKILRTAGSISGSDALAWRLIDEETDGDVVARAAEVVREIASGKRQARTIAREPISRTMPDVNIGPLSKKVDEILCRAIVDGAKLPLEQALENESKLFGEVCGTKDMRIGLENFLKTGGKTAPTFVHA